MNTLIMGMGNLLLADEGVGVHAVRVLASRRLPRGVRTLDVGTDILGALEDIHIAHRLIVVDAVKAGGAPGSIYRFGLDKADTKPVVASMHGFDLPRVLLLAQCRKLPLVTVIGVEPLRIEWSMELSPPVAKALPTVLRELELAAGVHGHNKSNLNN